MVSKVRGSSDETRRQVERSLERCLEWSRLGRHRKVVNEVERTLAVLSDHPQLEATLLIWKAQALLAMGYPERALPPASRSWELDPSPHACHLQSNALEALGDLDGSEELLRMGWRLFPEAVHLPVQLAVVLSDQARLPEALDILDEIEVDDRIPDDLQIFLFGMRSNLLAAMGRWAEADEALRDGLGFHPESEFLGNAQDALRHARRRARAEEALIASWQDGLEDLDGVAAEVDEAVIRCGAVNELPEIVTLAARRLWRAVVEQNGPKLHAPDPWSAALVLAILEIDGNRPSIASIARSVSSNPSSVRSVLSRLRDFLSSLDPEMRQRAFAAHSNPRLEGAGSTQRSKERSADVVPFPIR
jgi:tetratricopeptide (TPR) repeat protein